MQAVWSAEEASALASWLTFAVLLGSLIFAARQVKEAVRLREAQTRPFVVVDFDTEGILLNLTIRKYRLPTCTGYPIGLRAPHAVNP